MKKRRDEFKIEAPIEDKDIITFEENASSNNKKIDSFLYVLSETKDKDLCEMIWLKSKDSESWFIRTTNYSRSLAVMCIVGYILGLGIDD